MPVSRHLCWPLTNYFSGLCEELLGCLHIPVLREHGINQVTISINGPVQVIPLPVDLDVGFVHVPGVTSLTPTPGTQLLRDEWCEASLPIPDCLMGKFEAPLQEHPGQIPQAQLVSQSPQDNEQDNIRRVL